MTPLKPSEKRLLTILGIAGFLLLNLLGYSWLKKRDLMLSRQRITLETRQRELEFYKTLAPEAEKKRTFLDENLQAYADEATRETYLDQFIQKEAGDLNLDVRKNQPMPVKLEEHFHKSRYTAEVSGAWDEVFAFIYKLQSPKAFRFVSTLRLKSQKKEGATDEAADVVCTFEVEKWWSPESISPEDPLQAVTAPETAAPPTPDAAAPVDAPKEGALVKSSVAEQTGAPPVKTP